VSDESLPSKTGSRADGEPGSAITTTFHSDARGSNPMSEGTITPARRVRHEVRDSLAVMAFSALSSCGIAVLLTVLVRN